MAKTIYRSWTETPIEEKEIMVNDFLEIMREKLLDAETKDINISCVKGIKQMHIGRLLVDQRFDGRVTYTIKINHNGDL